MKKLMILLILIASSTFFATEHKKHNPTNQEVMPEKFQAQKPFELVDIQFKSDDFYYPTFRPRTQIETEKKINPKTLL